MTDKSVSGQYTVQQQPSESGFSGQSKGVSVSGSVAGDQFQDLIFLYCSYFAYAPDGHQKRQEILLRSSSDIILSIQHVEQRGAVAKDTSSHIATYLESDENQQREIFDNNVVS